MWFCLALSNEELPHLYPAVTVPWKHDAFVFHVCGTQTMGIQAETLLASCVTWSHFCSILIPVPCPPRARSGAEALPSSGSCTEEMHKDPAAAGLMAWAVHLPHHAPHQVFGRGTGSSSAAFVSLGRKGEQSMSALGHASARPGEATHTPLPVGLLDRDKTPTQCVRVKEIADTSAAAAWVSVRSGQL